MPPVVNGWTDDVTVYEYDPQKARDLLAEAGYDESNPLELDFNYPVNVSRPYMPTPEETFTVVARQLEEVGIKIIPVTNDWGEYLDRVPSTDDHGIHFLGWTGDYNDSDNFVGVFFGAESAEWGFNDPELFSKLTEARGVPSIEEQTPLYEEINRLVSEMIP